MCYLQIKKIKIDKHFCKHLGLYFTDGLGSAGCVVEGLRRFRSFLVGTHDSFCRFLKCIKFLVETRLSGLPELRSDHEQSKMQ